MKFRIQYNGADKYKVRVKSGYHLRWKHLTRGFGNEISYFDSKEEAQQAISDYVDQIREKKMKDTWDTVFQTEHEV